VDLIFEYRQVSVSSVAVIILICPQDYKFKENLASFKLIPAQFLTMPNSSF
jgi:hypothetical protein